MSIDTVNDIAPRVQYVASAAQTVFDYPFPIFQDADLVVDVDGATKTLNTDYTVSGEGDDTGGDITFVSPLVGGEIVTIYRETEISRETDFQQNGPLTSRSINDEFDKGTLVMQELRSAVKRCLRLPVIAEVNDADIELGPISNWLSRFVFIGPTGVPEPAAGLSTVTLTQSVVGSVLNPQTTAETIAGATANTNIPSTEVFNFRRVRNPSVTEGVTNESVQLSQAAALAAGKVILLPKGTYLVTGTWTLTAGTTIVGEGPDTIIKMQSSQLAAADLAGLTFKNLKVTSSVTGAGLIFTRCDNLTFENVWFDGTIGGTNPAGTTALWLKGCDEVRVTGCRFINYANGVYAGDDALGEKCGTVRVSKCHFEHTLLSAASYPTGVYQYQCDYMYVDLCSFKNIFPGGADPSPRGYGFYEGDGASIVSSVTNSIGICTSVASNTGPFVFAQAAATVTFAVSNCYFNGAGESAEFVSGSGRTLTQVVGNYVLNSYCFLQPGDGATLCEAVIFERNYFRLANNSNAAVRVGGNGGGFNFLHYNRNVINGSTAGGLFVSDVRKYATVTNNTFQECNTADAAFSAGVNDYQVSCISFFGSRFGLVSGNYCENARAGIGRADYGFTCDGTTHSIDVRPDNRFIRMGLGGVRNTVNFATNPWPWYQPGAQIWFGDPTTGNPPGRVCTHLFQTTISSTEAGGQTVLSVTSNTGMAADDFVGILLDTGAYHYTYISSTGVGTITVNVALPSQAAAGNEVIVNRFKAMANLA
jgi:hypothetical protein